MEPDYTPYPDEDASLYRYTGTHLRFPNRDVATGGDIVALPDRVADHLGDALERIDADADDDVEADAEPEPEPEESSEDADEDGDGDDEGDELEAEPAPSDDRLALPEEGVDDLPEGFPADLPEDYNLLQKVATANGIDGRQSKADLVDALETLRDENGGE